MTSETKKQTKSKTAKSSATTRSTQVPKHPSTQKSTCPYHAPILNLETLHSKSYGQTPMERLLAGHASEQGSLYCRPDTGKLSTWRDCTCGGGGK